MGSQGLVVAAVGRSLFDLFDLVFAQNRAFSKCISQVLSRGQKSFLDLLTHKHHFIALGFFPV